MHVSESHEKDGNVTSSLVMAKAKLAQVRKITLLRLEQMGALLSARLITYVRKALLLPESNKVNCWTDSTVVLHWIRSDASRRKTFVQNCVTEFQKSSSLTLGDIVQMLKILQTFSLEV